MNEMNAEIKMVQKGYEITIYDENLKLIYAVKVRSIVMENDNIFQGKEFKLYHAETNGEQALICRNDQQDNWKVIVYDLDCICMMRCTVSNVKFNI